MDDDDRGQASKQRRGRRLTRSGRAQTRRAHHRPIHKTANRNGAWTAVGIDPKGADWTARGGAAFPPAGVMMRVQSKRGQGLELASQNSPAAHATGRSPSIERQGQVGWFINRGEGGRRGMACGRPSIEKPNKASQQTRTRKRVRVRPGNSQDTFFERASIRAGEFDCDLRGFAVTVCSVAGVRIDETRINTIKSVDRFRDCRTAIGFLIQRRRLSSP